MIETEEEFARGYAERSGVTVEWLRQHGRVPVPCDCGEDMCQGWRMVTQDEAYELLRGEKSSQT